MRWFSSEASNALRASRKSLIELECLAFKMESQSGKRLRIAIKNFGGLPRTTPYSEVMRCWPSSSSFTTPAARAPSPR